jgi:hypothetical protein
MSTQKFVSRLADDIQMIILHNPIPQKGENCEEELDRLFGNIHQVWQPLLDCLHNPAKYLCENSLRSLYTDFEGTRGDAVNLFAEIQDTPAKFMRADLV